MAEDELKAEIEKQMKFEVNLRKAIHAIEVSPERPEPFLSKNERLSFYKHKLKTKQSEIDYLFIRLEEIQNDKR